MKIASLTLLGFKNIERAELSFSPRINCLVGNNGAGKTNVLDALHYLSMCKGITGLSDQQSVRHGADFFVIEGVYDSDAGRSENVVCSFQRQSGKVVKRGGKEYERLSQHIGLLPLVGVFPSDVFLVSDAAEERRRYLNGFISQMDRGYLDSVIRYNNVLAQRNRILKENAGWGGDMLEVLDIQLSEHGTQIFEARRAMIERLAPLVAEYYAALSGDTEQVELSYRSELFDAPLMELLAVGRERDRMNRFTTSGVHRDDMVMTIGGYPLKKYGSQGQQKSFLVALKLAQYAVVNHHTGERPILLLDDLFDKLDVGRVERLLEIVSTENFGQIFITDCNKTRLENILKGKQQGYALFEVDGGAITNRQK